MSVRILLAVEDPLLRSLLTERMRQEEDFTIVGAVGDPIAFFEAVTLATPDVVVMDLQWSESIGVALLDRLAQEMPSVTTLVLVTDDAEEMQLEVARHGARGVVAKSEGATSLPHAVRALGRGDVWFTQQVSRRIFQEYQRLVRHSREQDRPLSGLSAREREVLALVAEGMTNREIAERLHMSVHTVKLHIQHILKKLELPNRTEAAVFAVREGLVSVLPRRDSATPSSVRKPHVKVA